MKNIVAYSENTDSVKAFEEVKAQIDEAGSPVLIIFCAPGDKFNYFAEEFYNAYPKAQSIGATGYYSYSSKGFSVDALSALVVYDGIECATGALFEISHFPMRYVPAIEKAVASLSSEDNTVGIAFSTAYGNCEELVQDTFREVLGKKNIPVVGGTAGGPTPASKTLVALNGMVYEEAAVFVLIRNLKGSYFIYKENIYRPTKTMVTATDVDCEERIVYEYDERPAKDVIQRVLRADEKDLLETFSDHPMGRITGDEIYITSCNRINKDGSIGYFARIYNQTRLYVLEPDDLDKVWAETAARVHEKIEKPSMCFTVNCFLRALYFDKVGRNSDFNSFLAEGFGNHVGLTGFGEQFNYEHFNQTMVMVVFE